MRHDTVTHLFPRAFAPALSLDALTAQPDADGFNRSTLRTREPSPPTNRSRRAKASPQSVLSSTRCPGAIA